MRHRPRRATNVAVTDEATPQRDDARLLRWALLATALVTLVRVAAVFATPLELYPDEAQYWLWAQAPDWGYASKPPMVAWLIAVSTAIGGDGEAWVRLPAPLLHAATALALFAAGRRLYDARVGLLACVLWLLTPAVALSSAFIATDAPFMLGLALSLWAYAALLDAPDGRRRILRALLLGAAAGLALPVQAGGALPRPRLRPARRCSTARRAGPGAVGPGSRRSPPSRW